MPSLFDLARSAHQDKDYPKALALYRAFLCKQPDHVHANYLYGTALYQADYPGQAAVFFKRSIALGPGFGPAYSNLGASYRQLGRIEQAEKVLKKAVEIGASRPIRSKDDIRSASDALANLGAVYYSKGEYEKSERALDEALIIDPTSALAHWNRGLVRLGRGAWAEGWGDYDWGYKANERKEVQHIGRYQEWCGEKLDGKTILVWGEQGIGDEIIFSSCLPALARDAGRVIYDCHPRLAAIFTRSFPEVEIVGRRKDLSGLWAIGAGVDYQVPIGSLPRFYRCQPHHFPIGKYLIPNAIRVAWWKKQSPGPLRVGISWRGGKGDQGEPHRSLPLADFGKFVRPLEGVSWISLQYGVHYPEIERFCKASGVELHCHEFAMENYEETCNLVAACDLVISVVTAVIHLAGALDVPTFTLVPKHAAWKFTPGEDIPWHASVRQFHQVEMDQWDDVLQQVARAFGKWYKEHHDVRIRRTP